jgi:hypothetical protein
VTDASARRAALSLPDAVEMDHHGRPSFRVKGRIFATLWVAGKMNVMLDSHGIMDAVDSYRTFKSDRGSVQLRIQMPDVTRTELEP